MILVFFKASIINFTVLIRNIKRSNCPIILIVIIRSSGKNQFVLIILIIINESFEKKALLLPSTRSLNFVRKIKKISLH